MESLVGEQHHQHVVDAAGQSSERDEHDEHPQRRDLCHRPQAAEDLGDDTAGRCSGQLHVRRHATADRRRARRGGSDRGADAEHGRRRPSREQHSGDQRPDKQCRLLGESGDDVGGDKVIGRARATIGRIHPSPAG